MTGLEAYLDNRQQEFHNPPPPLRYDHVTWYAPSPCLHAYETCNISIVIYSYLWVCRSFTNHSLWFGCQWFISMATYWSHCDVTVMHVRFISLLSISFCQKLQRDHHRSPLSGEYFVILLDSLTIRPWRDHGSDRNASGTLLWLICSCHSVFLGTSSFGFIYYFIMPISSQKSNMALKSMAKHQPLH